MNPNPRIGVLLRVHKASVRLFNCLNPSFGKLGLRRFQKEFSEDWLRRNVPGFGAATHREWQNLLEKRKTR